MSEKYIENPKTKGSGLLTAIPQVGRCPNQCKECFYQMGRSYLEPLEENLPNLPPEDIDHVIRINDGHDSFFLSKDQIEYCYFHYAMYYFNTSIPKSFDKYQTPDKKLVPIVLTVNPNDMTDNTFYKLDPIPKNLMFIRFRVNTWNITLAKECIEYYSKREIPIVLTFMAYHNEEDIPEKHRIAYIYRKRTLNSYYAIKTKNWKQAIDLLKWGLKGEEPNKWVYSCGQIEGELGDTHCRFCGNCLREYFATMERLRTR